jgi:uncharacterized damage-inducible protein DinB
VSEVEWIRRWYAYNAAARQGYLDTLSRLPPEELTRDRGASYPTLIDIMAHSLGGTSFWFRRMSTLYGEPFEGFDGPESMTLDDLQKFNQHTNKMVDQFFSRLSPGDLDRKFLVPKVPGFWDADFTAPVRGTLLHVIEHDLQHRGELNALLWQIDVDPPILDWGDFEELQAGSSNARP